MPNWFHNGRTSSQTTTMCSLTTIKHISSKILMFLCNVQPKILTLTFVLYQCFKIEFKAKHILKTSELMYG